MSIKQADSGSDKTPSFEMTWGSSTSSGYCSESDSDSEFEQYFTARTSFILHAYLPSIFLQLSHPKLEFEAAKNLTCLPFSFIFSGHLNEIHSAQT